MTQANTISSSLNGSDPISRGPVTVFGGPSAMDRTATEQAVCYLLVALGQDLRNEARSQDEVFAICGMTSRTQPDHTTKAGRACDEGKRTRCRP